MPLPRPTELTEPFWAAAAEGRLLLPKCDECGRCFFRPEYYCTHCASARWHWIESEGRGTLYSFSTVHRAPTTAFRVPYVIVAVDLDEGVAMLSNLDGCDPADARIGMRVRVGFQPVAAGVALPIFRPEEP
ncbi:MAG: Zn-ribbon domain-containing OB-fold protein [Acidimicrobiia bacterium]